MLTDAQITELHLALTSENTSDVETILSGLDLDGDTSGGDMSGDSMQMAAVGDLLVQSSYPEGTVSRLASSQVTELFIASTREDANGIVPVIDGLGLEGETGTFR